MQSGLENRGWFWLWSMYTCGSTACDCISHVISDIKMINQFLGPLKILLLQLSLFWWHRKRRTSFWIFDLCDPMNDTAYQECIIYCCEWLKFLLSLRFIKIIPLHSPITVLWSLSSKLPFVYYSSAFYVMLGTPWACESYWIEFQFSKQDQQIVNWHL